MSKKNENLVIENVFTPVEYDPQYILQVNALKKYFPIKDGIVAKTVVMSVPLIMLRLT